MSVEGILWDILWKSNKNVSWLHIWIRGNIHETLKRFSDLFLLFLQFFRVLLGNDDVITVFMASDLNI